MHKMRVLGLAIAGLFAGNAYSVDLLQVYRDAESYDAVLASARYQSEANKEQKAQGLSGLLPQIGASAGTHYNDSSRDLPQPEVSGRYNSNNWGVQLTQPLFRMQNWYQYRQGELASTAAEMQYQNARQDLMLRVATAYFNLLNAQETLASIEAQKTATLQQLELAKKSFEVGTTTITDVHEAQSRYDLAVAQEAATVANVEVARQQLVQIAGKDYGPLAPLRDGVKFQAPQPNDVKEWVHSAEEGNLLAQTARLSYEIADRGVGVARAGHLPTVDAVASYGYNHQGALADLFQTEAKSTVGSIGLQVQVPIFAGGYTQSKVRESLALRDKAQSDYDNARRSAALGAQQAFLGVTAGIAQVAGYEAALLSSRSAVESNKLGYQVGVRINIDVLNAETQFYETYRLLARSRYDTMLAQLKLKNAAGNLAETDLQMINALLDPEAAGRPITLPDTTPKPVPGNSEATPAAKPKRK